MLLIWILVPSLIRPTTRAMYGVRPVTLHSSRINTYMPIFHGPTKIQSYPLFWTYVYFGILDPVTNAMVDPEWIPIRSFRRKLGIWGTLNTPDEAQVSNANEAISKTWLFPECITNTSCTENYFILIWSAVLSLFLGYWYCYLLDLPIFVGIPEMTSRPFEKPPKQLILWTLNFSIFPSRSVQIWLVI